MMAGRRGKRMYVQSGGAPAGPDRCPYPDQTQGIDADSQAVIDDGVMKLNLTPLREVGIEGPRQTVTPKHLDIDAAPSTGTAYHCQLDASGKDTSA